MQVDLIVVANELKDGHMKSTREGHAVLRHADGVVLRVWTPGKRDKRP